MMNGQMKRTGKQSGRNEEDRKGMKDSITEIILPVQL
jgi:hypothetical protein